MEPEFRLIKVIDKELLKLFAQCGRRKKFLVNNIEYDFFFT